MNINTLVPNTFEYKGYVSHLTVDADDNLIHDLVINVERDTITFRGETLAETKQDFQETIDEYLADCFADSIEADVPPMFLKCSQQLSNWDEVAAQ